MAEGQTTVAYREIPGFPAYRVGDDGSLWSRWVRKSGGARGSKKVLGNTWKRLKLHRNRGTGYLQTGLYVNGRHFLRRVHRLVIETFVGPCPKGMQCCHGDGDRTNNALSNLRWDTPSANQADRMRHGTDLRGESHPGAKFSTAKVLAIRAEYATGSFTKRELSKRHGIGYHTIHGILRRHSWRHA